MMVMKVMMSVLSLLIVLMLLYPTRGGMVLRHMLSLMRCPPMRMADMTTMTPGHRLTTDRLTFLFLWNIALVVPGGGRPVCPRSLRDADIALLSRPSDIRSPRDPSRTMLRMPQPARTTRSARIFRTPLGALVLTRRGEHIGRIRTADLGGATAPGAPSVNETRFTTPVRGS